MRKAILIIAVTLLNICNVFAQKITNEKELKNFYIEYLSMDSKETEAQADSLVRSYCTKELYDAWNTDVNEVGLYDPLTNGYFDDLMKKTLVVKKESDHYVVSFKYSTWRDNKIKEESIIIYVNTDGKISHTKRPSDGYITP